jgi:error-prone DNA polymerase
LGVPIFQEQVMQLAVVAAGFTPGEADQLRRSMATFRRRGGMEKFEKKLIDGMRKHGYRDEFAKQICQQIQGFGEYGFPESHSASFALLAYVSAWLKRHHPAAFTCALLNSQPMGFYSPSQLVQDARRHGVEVRGVDVCRSEWDCTLEPETASGPALRLGLRLVNGVTRAGMDRLVEARREKAFADIADGAEARAARQGWRGCGLADLKHRAQLARDDLDCLAAAGALAALGGNRHQAFWTAAGVEPPVGLAAEFSPPEAIPMLRSPTEGEDLCADYASTGLTLGRHPLALLRGRLARENVRTAADFQQLRNGARARAAGLVVCRQHPSSANGVIFLTLEDETGVVNVIVWESVARAQRQALLDSTLLEVTGSVQHEDGVLHLVAGRLRDRSGMLGALKAPSRDFR